MPHLSFACRAGQPIMPVLVQERPTKARAARRAPEPVLVDALIDTAADCSVIQPEIARRLGLEPIRRRNVRTPTTGERPDQRNVYAVSVLLVHPQRQYSFPSFVEVIESSLGHGDCEMLLGRDVLGSCLFILDGATRFTSPSRAGARSTAARPRRRGSYHPPCPTGLPHLQRPPTPACAC